MKKIVVMMTAALMTLALCACGGQTAPSASPSNVPASASPSAGATAGTIPTPKEGSTLTFAYQGCKLPMNAQAADLLAYLGEAESYFEAESCAFKGLDKTYTYPGFELVTYPVEGVDFVSDIFLLDDTVSTPEGIKLGSTLAEVLTAYGQDYKENLGQYNFTNGDTTLSIGIENDEVATIEYIALNDQLT